MTATSTRRSHSFQPRLCIKCDEPAVYQTSLCAEHKRQYDREWRARRKLQELTPKPAPVVDDIGGEVVDPPAGECRRLDAHTFAVRLDDKLRLTSQGLRLGLLKVPIAIRRGIEATGYQWAGQCRDRHGQRWGLIRVVWLKKPTPAGGAPVSGEGASVT